jgi:predicted Ser/Thr protein kinase
MTESRPSDIFKPGDLLNNTYRIEAILGRGGTSEVYRARNEVSKRLIAIKALKSEFSDNEDYLTLMTREEEIREIRHDAVVRYSENHRAPDGTIYLVMDYVEGPALEKVMQDGGMSADDLLKVIRRVAEGLRAAHNRNIVHRDLSPDNIILRGGKPDQAVIIDFGIAKDTNPEAKTIIGNAFAGKYGYAAPEQLSGHSDPRTDLYSLGALILATFRGKKPVMGSNPMEVVQNKAKPLDTSGVPEPLKALIDRMSHPIPERRFQSADELLAALEPGAEDRTVIVRPQTQVRTELPAGARPEIIVPPAARPTPPPARKGRGGLLVLLLLLLLGGGGAAAWFTGALDPLLARFLGPTLPVQDPYSLIVERPEDGAVRAIGSAPSQEIADGITGIVNQLGGTAQLSLATGPIAETWGADILTVLAAAEPLDEFRLIVNNNEARLTGRTKDAELHARLSERFRDGLPGALEGRADVVLGPVAVTREMLQPVLDQYANCGPLDLGDVPPTGFPTGATITVDGKVATTQARVGLFEALQAVAPERTVEVRTEVLNEELCAVETKLPQVGPGGFGIRFGFGDRPDDNTSGRYFVGENPVIDVVIPPEVTDGFLTVTILDSTGAVFHLLPNLNRPENAIAALRKGSTGPVTVRVARGNEEATPEPTLAFTVSPDALGKSKIVAVHSDAPLFDVMRPSTESIAGFAEALAENNASGAARVLSLDSRILTTAAK